MIKEPAHTATWCLGILATVFWQATESLSEVNTEEWYRVLSFHTWPDKHCTRHCSVVGLPGKLRLAYTPHDAPYFFLGAIEHQFYSFESSSTILTLISHGYLTHTKLDSRKDQSQGEGSSNESQEIRGRRMFVNMGL